MGMAFPVGIALWVSDVSDEHAGERIGVIYAVNVAGAVAGSLLTGFLLLPAIGGRDSLLLTSALSLGIGPPAADTVSRRGTASRWRPSALGGFGLVAWANARSVVELLRSRYPREVPVWRQEDGHASVAILRGESRSRHRFTCSTSTARTRRATPRRWWPTTG